MSRNLISPDVISDGLIIFQAVDDILNRINQCFISFLFFP